MGYDSLITWIENKLGINFEDRITEDYYKNYDLVKEDIEKVKNKVDETAKTHIAPIEKGKFRTITREQTINGVNQFFEQYMEPRLNESVEDTNTAYLEDVKRIKSYSEIKAIKREKYLPETLSDVDFEIKGRSSELEEDSIIRIRDSNTEADIESIVSEASGTKSQSKLRKEANFRINDLKRRGII